MEVLWFEQFIKFNRVMEKPNRVNPGLNTSDLIWIKLRLCRKQTFEAGM